MNVRILFIVLMAVMSVGCGQRQPEYFPYYENGKAKPKTVLLPFADSTDGCAPWNIGTELGTDLFNRIMCRGLLFLIPQDETVGRLQGCDRNFFTPDLSIYRRFCGSDYVVALELIEHSLVPYRRGMCNDYVLPQKYHWRSVLETKVRLRIVDVRCSEPKVLLQEIFASRYPVPTDKECLDYSVCCPGTELYPSTPWCKAHEQLIEQLVCRIDSVILDR